MSPLKNDATLSPEDRRVLKGLLLAVLSMQIMTPFLQSGVAVLLPALGEYFKCSGTELGLVTTVYCMALSIFSLAAGRGGDKLGRRRLCLTSMLILVPTTLAISFCETVGSVILLRFFQGIGTSCFFTSALAMLVAASPDSMRGRMLGITTTGVYIGLSVGPLVGGYINAVWGWQAFFRLIACWAAMCFFIMFFQIRREWREGADRPYDWGGFALFGLGMSILVTGCVGPVPQALRVPCSLAGGALLVLFGVWEYRLKYTMPLLDVRVLGHNRLFVLSNLASFMLYASLYSLTFFFSLYLQYARGLDSAQAGTLVFIQPVIQILFTLPCGWLSDRIGAFPIALAGNILAVATLAMILFLTPATPMWYICLILALNGIGMALFVTPNTVLIMTSVDPAHMSQASGAVGTVRTGGMVASMVIATYGLRVYMGDAPMSVETVPELMQALKFSFAIFLGLNVFSLICSLMRMPKKAGAA